MATPKTTASFFSPRKKKRLTPKDKRYMARFGNYSFRHPIDHAFWNKMSHISILGAVLYTFGVDPEAPSKEMEHTGEPQPLEELESYMDDRRAIIKSAVLSGLIKTVGRRPKLQIHVGDSLNISLSSFKKWCKENDLSCEPTLAAPKYPEYQPGYIKPERDKSKNKSNTPTSDFDPLFLSAISMIFILDRDALINKTRWKALAKDANRNGLVGARIVKGEGKRESTFDPTKIGDWLVTKAYKTVAEVNKILVKNLPDRSAHKKDYYLQ